MLGRVLTLGTLRQTLPTIRSVARAAHPVTVGLDRNSFLSRSRYVDETWRHVDPRRHEALADELVGLLSDRPDIRYVFPTGDTTVAAVARHYDRISRYAVPVIPSAPTALSCLDKGRVYALAERVGVPAPLTRQAANAEELDRHVREIGYPCVIKPNDSLGESLGVKAIICRGETDLRRRLPQWPAGQRLLLVQRYAPGLRVNCEAVAVDGQIKAMFQWLALRTESHDNTGLTVEAVAEQPEPRLMDFSRRVIAGLNYTGVALLQFLRDDATGEAAFLEINPRMSAFVHFACACGYDYPLLALRCAEHLAGHDGPAPVWPDGSVAGRRFHWFVGDLISWLGARGDPELPPGARRRWLWQLARASMRSNAPMSWSIRDPGPALYESARFVARPLWRRLRRLLRRRRKPVPSSPAAPTLP